MDGIAVKELSETFRYDIVLGKKSRDRMLFPYRFKIDAEVLTNEGNVVKLLPDNDMVTMEAGTPTIEVRFPLVVPSRNCRLLRVHK